MKIDKKVIANVTNEILFVGSIYANFDLLVEYGIYIRSKYDFSDEATKYFYDNAEIIYKTRSEKPTRATIAAYFQEDIERLNQFNKYGGFKTIDKWVDLAVPDEMNKTYDLLKKYSLLREYDRKGFDVSKIMEHKNFETFKANDIYRLIRSQADRIHTIILTNQQGVVLNEGMTDMMNSCLETPDMGIPLPFPLMNDQFRGVKYKTMFCTGMLSNAGKSRFMFRLIAWLALVHKQKVYVMLNEMTIERMRLCLLTTVINNDEFKALHGVKLSKREKEIALGIYHDQYGEEIIRTKDNDGNAIESLDDYIKRVAETSKEYQGVAKIAKWIEEQTEGLIFAKDVSAAYDDKTLEFEIRKMNMTRGIRLFFYDTLKQDVMNTGDWAALKVTTTKLSELTRELNCFIYGSIQLTDDANYIKPDELTSSQISVSKTIKHVLDNLILCKEIGREERFKYQYIRYDKDFGEQIPKDLDEKKRYYIMNIDKNRDGQKCKLIYEVNLDLNTWVELGEAVRKQFDKNSKNKKAKE